MASVAHICTIETSFDLGESCNSSSVFINTAPYWGFLSSGPRCRWNISWFPSCFSSHLLLPSVSLSLLFQELHFSLLSKTDCHNSSFLLFKQLNYRKEGKKEINHISLWTLHSCDCFNLSHFFLNPYCLIPQYFQDSGRRNQYPILQEFSFYGYVSILWKFCISLNFSRLTLKLYNLEMPFKNWRGLGTNFVIWIHSPDTS